MTADYYPPIHAHVASLDGRWFFLHCTDPSAPRAMVWVNPITGVRQPDPYGVTVCPGVELRVMPVACDPPCRAVELEFLQPNGEWMRAGLFFPMPRDWPEPPPEPSALAWPAPASVEIRRTNQDFAYSHPGAPYVRFYLSAERHPPAYILFDWRSGSAHGRGIAKQAIPGCGEVPPAAWAVESPPRPVVSWIVAPWEWDAPGFQTLTEPVTFTFWMAHADGPASPPVTVTVDPEPVVTDTAAQRYGCPEGPGFP